MPGRVSMPGDDRYAAATAIWPKPVGRMPRAVVHYRTAKHAQSAIRAARDGELPLSVRRGGHDWAGRALCDGVVIDLSGMKDVVVGSGGARGEYVTEEIFVDAEAVAIWDGLKASSSAHWNSGFRQLRPR